MITKEGLTAALLVVKAVADAIRELGEVPSGVLYANLAGTMDLRTYQAVITQLKTLGMVQEHSHVLVWVDKGPTPT